MGAQSFRSTIVDGKLEVSLMPHLSRGEERRCAKHGDATFDDRHDGTVCFTIDIELGPYGSDTCLSAVNDEGPRTVFGNVKQGLPLDKIDSAFVFVVSDANF